MSLSSQIVDPYQVTSYLTKFHEKAEKILDDQIPSQLTELTGVLKGEEFRPSYAEAAREFCENSLNDFLEQLKEISDDEKEKGANFEKVLQMLFGGKQPNKKEKDGDDDMDARKSLLSVKKSKTSKGRLNSTSSNKSLKLEARQSNISIELKLTDSARDLIKKKSVSLAQACPDEEDEEVEKEEPVIPANTINVQLQDIIRPYLLDLADIVSDLRTWIILLIPRVEDGNNFGVEVQEHILSDLKSVEDEINQQLELISAYHLSRGSTIGKVVNSPEIEDYREFLMDEDEKQCRRLQNAAKMIRTKYTHVLQQITQNYDKIVEPRGVHSNSHMY